MTANTVSGSNSSFNTVVDTAAASGLIPKRQVGLFIAPQASTAQGTITFGGADTSLTSGDVSFVPVSQDSEAGQFWGIDQSISYGGQQLLSTTSGIVDSGTTLFLLPDGELYIRSIAIPLAHNIGRCFQRVC